jgi:glycosyltransferase involved in cell wall biosynthesis
MDENIAIVIPAYNEEQTIATIVDRCSRYTSNVIVVDDGSTDNTLAQLKNTTADVLIHAKNAGKGAALLRGFQAAIEKNCQGVITIDADGQHNPDDLPQFFSRISQSPDTLIIGARQVNTHLAPKLRLFANKTADFFISVACRKYIIDTQSGYRYYPMSFLKRFARPMLLPNRFAFEAEILVSAIRLGLSVDYVDIHSCYPTDARASHYHPSRDTWQIAKVVAKLIFTRSNAFNHDSI